VLADRWPARDQLDACTVTERTSGTIVRRPHGAAPWCSRQCVGAGLPTRQTLEAASRRSTVASRWGIEAGGDIHLVNSCAEGTKERARTYSASCTPGLRTELRDRTASPRTRHRTPNGASGAPRSPTTGARNDRSRAGGAAVPTSRSPAVCTAEAVSPMAFWWVGGDPAVPVSVDMALPTGRRRRRRARRRSSRGRARARQRRACSARDARQRRAASSARISSATSVVFDNAGRRPSEPRRWHRCGRPSPDRSRPQTGYRRRARICVRARATAADEQAADQAERGDGGGAVVDRGHEVAVTVR
jgi:hypothetical protein